MVCIDEVTIDLDSDEDMGDIKTISNQLETHAEMAANFAPVPSPAWKLQRLVGGHLILHRPIFSEDGEYIFTISGNAVQVYNSTTGVIFQKLAEANNKLVGMDMDLLDSKVVVGCSDQREIIRWKWKSGKIEGIVALDLPANVLVRSFNLLNYYDATGDTCAFITYQHGRRRNVHWDLFNTITGKKIKTDCALKLQSDPPLVAVHKKSFKTIVVCQRHFIHTINYETWEFNRLFNANKVRITAVCIHPNEDLVATGDEHGKVFLWRNFMSKQQVKMSLYHWHHTVITNIAFSSSGSHFFSSGHEATLVKWDVNHPTVRSFMARFSAIIRQIAVSEENGKVAVCTADNAVQIIGSDNKINISLQEFTYIPDDKSNPRKFPVGLRFNPRMDALVLNGRTGHLQFYSTYTKSLLFNMDVVMQNQLSMETGRILYNTNVTNAAFHMYWLATSEVFNDLQHFPEVRLKFWKYEEDRQSYVLNTNVEMAHEVGIKDIQFSTSYGENILCATVGEDNGIKIWAPDDSGDIHKHGKVWFCIAQTRYGNSIIDSICFSDDGTVLCAGYDNVLCVYTAENLKLKCCLSTTADLNSCPRKIQITIPTENEEKPTAVHTRKIQRFLNKICDNQNDVLADLKKVTPFECDELEWQTIDQSEKRLIRTELMNDTRLRFDRKLLALQKLGESNEIDVKLFSHDVYHLMRNTDGQNLCQNVANLFKQLAQQSPSNFFKAKYRIKKFTARKDLLQDVAKTDTIIKSAKAKLQKLSKNSLKEETEQQPDLNNFNFNCEIRHVQCLSGNCSNMVLVCTSSNVLVWNLMTRRYNILLQESVQHVAYDKLTNLIALITRCNKLLVYDTLKLAIIYEHNDMPLIYDAIWIPRRNPKEFNVYLHWQAKSILYFLTLNQEIVYLALDSEITQEQERTPAVFGNLQETDHLNYTTFGAFAAKQVTDRNKMDESGNRTTVQMDSRRTAVQSLLEMSVHTMAPISLLCNDFMRTVLTNVKQEEALTSESKAPAIMNGFDAPSEESDSDNEVSSSAEVSDTSKRRRQFLVSLADEQINEGMDNIQDRKSLEQELKAFAALNIHLDM